MLRLLDYIKRQHQDFRQNKSELIQMTAKEQRLILI